MTSAPATACSACGETATSSPLCRNCTYAFAVARAVHPASAAGDPDFWDAWALLGDAGNHRDRPLRRDGRRAAAPLTEAAGN